MRELYGSREGQGQGWREPKPGAKDGPASPSAAQCAGAAARLCGALGSLRTRGRRLGPRWSCFSRAGAAVSLRDERGRGRPLGLAAGAQLRVWMQCTQDPPPVLLLLRKWLPGLPGAGGVAAPACRRHRGLKLAARRPDSACRGVLVRPFCVLRCF